MPGNLSELSWQRFLFADVTELLPITKENLNRE